MALNEKAKLSALTANSTQVKLSAGTSLLAYMDSDDTGLLF